MSPSMAQQLPVISTTSSYWLCFTPRCGSELLSGMLRSTGIAGDPDELFWVHRELLFGANISPMEVYKCLHRIVAAGSTENGVFGVKLSSDHVPNLGDYMCLTSPKPRCIYLSRDSKVRQAVSWAIGIQTGRWWETGPRPSTIDLEYSSAQIRELLGMIGELERSWEKHFDDYACEVLRLSYEEMVLDRVGCLVKALEFIGVDYAAVDLTHSSDSSLRKQSDAISEVWVRRFLAE